MESRLVAIPVVVDLLLRQTQLKGLPREEGVAIPVVVDLLLRHSGNTKKAPGSGRNPCCSGPTASTELTKYICQAEEEVAIPVVVDLLLRPNISIPRQPLKKNCRNPCCSGPTASTIENIHFILTSNGSQSLL